MSRQKELIPTDYAPDEPHEALRGYLELYRSFPSIGGIAHTHSINAVAFAQAGKDILALGTTHADYFYGSVPCTRKLTETEVTGAYELNTGKVIAECFQRSNYSVARQNVIKM